MKMKMNYKSILSILMTLLLCMSMVSAIDYSTHPNFRVAITGYDSKIVDGDYTDVSVRVTNWGANGCMNVEAGIYQRGMLDLWGATIPELSAQTVANCESMQTNVQTKRICLDNGAFTSDIYHFKVPDIAGTIFTKNHDFAIYAGSFDNCYNTGLPTSQTDYDRIDVTLYSGLDILDKETAFDGQKNQDESDIDCGGDNAPACNNGYICNVKDDCISNYCNGRCEEVPDLNDDGVIDEDDYATAGSETPTQIKINEIIETATPYVLIIITLLILFIVAPFVLPIIADGARALFKILRNLLPI